MHVHVFFSWQVDTPAETGKNLVLEALRTATERIAADVEAPIRRRKALVQGTRGGPAGRRARCSAFISAPDHEYVDAEGSIAAHPLADRSPGGIHLRLIRMGHPPRQRYRFG
jgi:hypothetical protein